MEYAIVTAPAAAIRRKGRHASEMVNQLLFGETVRILRRKSDLWVRVRSLHDGYEGWLTTTQIETVSEERARARFGMVVGEFLSPLKLADRVLHIPFGSTLPSDNGLTGEINGRNFIFEGKTILTGETERHADRLREHALSWLNVPYLWGGRTPLGVDCSGFVQLIYKLAGIYLPRDAWQQAQEGMLIRKFKDALPGDLLFFDEKEEIVHVGMLIEPGVMIHSSGKVRVDAVNRRGLVEPEIKSRKLRLRMIRRLLV